MVNSRTNSGPPARRTQAERRRATRQALIDATLIRMEAGESFDTISLRGVAKAAGVVPAAFYRHFESMDELGLALVEESFRTLRGLLRQARENAPPPDEVIVRSVRTLAGYVRDHRQHFAFVARSRGTSSPRVYHAIRSEVRLFTSELATDLARFPVLREWTTEDLHMIAGLLVTVSTATVEAILEADPADDRLQAEIERTAAKQLRLVVLGVPHWRSR